MRYLFLALFFVANVFAAGPNLPALNLQVVDMVGLLGEDENTQLQSAITDIFNQGGPQIAILIPDDLQGYPIEDYSIAAAEKWKLGGEKKDNGLLIVIAPKERKMRIEVGGGIEGEITDLDADKWIRQILRPAFKEGNYGQGLYIVLQEVASRFEIKLSGTPVARRVTRQDEELSPAAVVIFLIIMFFILPFMSRRRGRGGMYYGGGGGWGSGGGGSSWGGGGGGFSGGGASGDW
ncbi:MAG: TPM domain-containing protein [Bacteriovoracaceae bacterium]|nr:TPM domain-containing protein [Bacteriovoracaceae bacterium]